MRDVELDALGVEDVTLQERHGAGVLPGTHDGAGNSRLRVMDPEPEPAAPHIQPGQCWVDPTGARIVVLELIPAGDTHAAAWRCQVGDEQVLRAPRAFLEYQLEPSVGPSRRTLSASAQLTGMITRVESGENTTVEELGELARLFQHEQAMARAGVLLATIGQWESTVRTALNAIAQSDWPAAMEALIPAEASIHAGGALFDGLVTYCRERAAGGVDDVGGVVLQRLAHRHAAAKGNPSPWRGDHLLALVVKAARCTEMVAMSALRQLAAAGLIDVVAGAGAGDAPGDYSFVITERGLGLAK